VGVVGALDGRILYANSAVSRILGYSAADLERLHVLDLNPDDQRIEAVLLHDGMRCHWAGDATPAFDGKRVNFSCQSETGAEYVLVGDVVQGDEGWTIERGVLVRSADAVKLEKVAPILIDALGVRG